MVKFRLIKEAQERIDKEDEQERGEGRSLSCATGTICRFPLDVLGSVDSAPICIPCRSQWLTSGVWRYEGRLFSGSADVAYFSTVCSLSHCRQSTGKETLYTTQPQSGFDDAPIVCSVFQRSDLLDEWCSAYLDRLWMRAYKTACGVSKSTASCILRLPADLGGRNLATPLAVVCETVWNHLESCCFGVGGLRELLFWNTRKRYVLRTAQI